MATTIRSLLRPQEEVKAVLEGELVANPVTMLESDSDHEEDLLEGSQQNGLTSRAVIAVVSHKTADAVGGDGEGSLFIFVYGNSSQPNLHFHRALPIHTDFSISVSISESRATPQSRKQSFALTITPAHTTQSTKTTRDERVVTLRTSDITNLRSVLAECRTIREIADKSPPSPSRYEWLIPYTHTAKHGMDVEAYVSLLLRNPPSLFPNLNPNLESTPLPQLPTPLSPTLTLSNASAGDPGDRATEDLELLIDVWVRAQARRIAITRDGKATEGNKTALRIRTGTFNVNGGLPGGSATQDAGSEKRVDMRKWVRGILHPETKALDSKNSGSRMSIPPIPAVSPLSMGGIDVDNGPEAVEFDFKSETGTKEQSVSEGSDSPQYTDIDLTDDAQAQSISEPRSEVTTLAESPESIASAETKTNAIIPKSATTLSGDTNVGALPEAPGDDPNIPPDLLVFSFQELDLSTEALLYSTKTTREDAWCAAVLEALDPGNDRTGYVKLASKQLVGMLMLVLVRKPLRDCFEVKTAAIGAGIMGIMGNKGATAIRLVFTPPPPSHSSFDPKMPSISTTLTFVNSHLAAFDEMVERRNADFWDLGRRLKFECGSEPRRQADGSVSMVKIMSGLYESDLLIWMGDLNYRLDIPDLDVRSILASASWGSKNLETLLNYDQLKRSMRTGKAFPNHVFSEQTITHPPTYRFSPGYLTDELGYDLKRKPAWTDRILYASGPSVGIQQINYTGHPEVTMSDHRPVSADFIVHVDTFHKKIYEDAVRDLYRQVGGLLDEASQERPTIKIESTTIDFGKVSYKRSVVRTLRLKNTGKVPCAYRFLPIELGTPIHPEWLRIEPIANLILPGETATITLTVYINNNSASRLNLGSKELDCTLILHTILGQDHFISLAGQYEYTCYANKLSRLIVLPGPIRDLASPQDLLPPERAINAPREIMRLVNWLMTDTSNLDGLFLSSADTDVVDEIHECLDTGHEFPYKPNSEDPRVALAFGETLLQLLDSLAEPVIPPTLHAKCLQATNRDEAFELLDVFPPASVNVWISVTAFLHFIGQQSNDPVAKTERLAAIFAPVLMRDDADAPVSPLGRQNFVLYFIS